MKRRLLLLLLLLLLFEGCCYLIHGAAYTDLHMTLTLVYIPPGGVSVLEPLHVNTGGGTHYSFPGFQLPWWKYVRKYTRVTFVDKEHGKCLTSDPILMILHRVH